MTSAALQFLAFIGMTHIVSEVLAHKGDVLASYQTDAEVEAYEKEQEATLAEVARITRLGDLSAGWRRLLIGSCLCIVGSSYLVLFMPSRCFAEFQLSRDKIEDMCFWSGCSKVFLKPAGLGCLVCVTLGLCGWRLFGNWSRAQLKAGSAAPPGSSAPDIRGGGGLVTEHQ